MVLSPADAVLATLNPAQRRAVTADADTVAILAGPGSGKTHTLTSRVVWLVDRVGHRPEDVVVATFTVKAAREMRERIGRVLGSDRERRVVLGTFHSLARRYLAAYGRHIGLSPRFGIADDGDSRAIVQRICKRLKSPVDPATARAWISKKKARGGAGEDAAASAKNTRPRPPPPPHSRAAAAGAASAAATRDLEAIHAEYQAQLARSNLLDYDDLLVRCAELLRRHPACVANVQAVLIDEYQDTNGAQYELMRLLAQARRRITVVGDPDQSIYGWRSAEIRNLYRLLREFPATAEVSLEDNYRSSGPILAAALAVIQQDQARYKKVLRPVRDGGARPVLRKLRSAGAEADWIVAEIGRLARLTGGMVGPADVAVLLRSASLSRHVEAALGRAGIGYRMVGGFKFYDRAEVKIVLDYLRVVHQADNNDAVARILNVPRRGIGDITVKNLLDEAEQAGLSLWALLVRHCRGERTAKTAIKKAVEQRISGDLIRILTAAQNQIKQGQEQKQEQGQDQEQARQQQQQARQQQQQPCYSLVELIRQVVDQIKLRSYLEENYVEDHEPRWVNVLEFISLAADFARDLAADTSEGRDEDALPAVDGISRATDTDPLGRFLANVSLASDAQRGGESGGGGSADGVVTISTIHAAKGLEWPVVFVPAVYQGSIPHSRAEDLDEERRLLYVAMTRAKAMLYLSWPVSGAGYGAGGGNSSSSRTELSPFLPADVTAGFAKRGPPLERALVEEVGRILGREAKPQAEIFKNMPPMAGLLDDRFPVDPDRKDEGGEQPEGWKRGRTGSAVPGGGGEGGAAQHQHGQRQPIAKRQRTMSSRDSSSSDWLQNLKDVEFLGVGNYRTTMSQRENFSLSSLPGFKTATDIHNANLAEMAAVAAGQKAPISISRSASEGGVSARWAKRQPDQPTLLEFVKWPGPRARPTDATANAGPAPAGVTAPPLPPPPPPPPPAPPAGIDPALTSHRLPDRNALLQARPVPVRPGGDAGGGEQEAAASRKRYGCFSSSPPRGEPEESGSEGPVELTRPSTNTLHVTTMMMVAAGVRPRYGPLTRLQMTGQLTPMERLRRPFRPPTLFGPRQEGGGAREGGGPG